MIRALLATLVTFTTLTACAQSIRTVDVSLIGGKSITTWHGQADLQALHVSVVHPLSPRTEVSFGVAPVTLWQPRSWFGEEFGDGHERVRALATSVMIRRTFGRASNRLHWFVEGGTGPMVAEKRVPASTSRFNFMTQAGGGVELMPNARFPLFLAYRFLHISNGGYAPRNPGLNVSSLSVGVRFRTATTRRR
ncbi:MAG TPA: acyloxyacyl hydrolase [Thermoanaerobaculia bacterium]|nr:acyloxyacyl hydrolase [Thermoanaerobaculia bacterium]